MSLLIIMLWGVLVAACLPFVLKLMLPPLPPFSPKETPGCVLVLGAGRRQVKDKQLLSSRSLVRLEKGLALARQAELPMLVSGGVGNFLAGQTEAELMAALAKPRIGRGLAVWQEHLSNNTYENASFSAAILRKKGIKQVYVVTDNAHLCRAMLCLRKQGIVATPYATHELPTPSWLPHVGVLMLWPEVIYEWMALGWYVLRRRV